MGHLNSWKGKEESKWKVYGNTCHCPWSGGKSGFLAKAYWLAEYHLTFGLIETANSTKSYRAGKSLLSLTDPACSSSCLPPLQSLALSICLSSLLLLLFLARTRVGEYPLFACFPSGNVENKMHTKACIHVALKQDRQLHNHRTRTRKDNSKVKLWPEWGGERL